MFSTPIETARDVPWLPPGSSLELFRGKMVPPRELVTSIHLLCFSDDRLLMVKDEERGWDIPGGHVEEGEELESALRRELGEEAAAEAHSLEPFATFKLHVPNPPAGYPYPFPVSYISCFLGKVARLNEFSAKFETLERKLMTPNEVRSLPWYRNNRALYELALAHPSR
ncbi:MAG: NUDIX domain-containing protein [Bdellovibrionales bacterium]|nr:NUDIX domain-containing protein [Bdellovibrionales bacterium]